MVSSFPNITPQQIIFFLKNYLKSQIKEFTHLRSIFENHSIGFDSVVEFLNKINLIKIKNNKVLLDKELSIRLDKGFTNINEILLEKLLISSNKYYDDIHDFFKNLIIDFKNSKINIDFRANYIYSNLRNFLTLSGLFIFNSIEKEYEINSELDYLLMDFLDYNKGLHPETLIKIQNKQKSLGDKAELEIIKYEKKRLLGYDYLINKLDHIALKNVEAGYDIKSFEIPNEITGRIVPRYIEVKAVSIRDYSFYFSAIELNKALILKEKYFLYLLPIKNKSGFISKKLEIIQNPVNVLFDKDIWNNNIEKYKFSLTNLIQYES